MNIGQDIQTLDDIKKLVDYFYEKVRQDELLAPVFHARIQNGWPEHLERMYAFWQTVLLHKQAYHGSPFPPHMRLPISQSHFERWLALFSLTIDALFEGENANSAKSKAAKMSEMFQSKIEFYKTNGFKNLM